MLLKISSRWLGLFLVTGLVGISSGCSSDSSPTSISSGDNSAGKASATEAKFSDRQIVSDFANQVAIPTQQLFAKRAEELSSAVNALVQNPNSQTLKVAQSAWVAARSPWEQSEGFTFGPASSLGYDGALDTWPVNETDLKAVLKGKDKITTEYVANLKDTEKGFHVIEYLLFGENNSKTAAEFNQRELDYLQGMTTNFSQVANELVASWTEGVEGQPAYKEVIATAGESGNSIYPSLQAGAGEMVQGMLDSLDEVANEKLAQPFEEKNPGLLESRFSNNTLTDIKTNVKGAQNIYLGSFPDGNTSGMGLSAYVAKVNPSLDTQIKNEFQASFEALNEVPDPLEKEIANPQAADKIQSAQKAINTLQATIEQKVLPLVNS